MNFAPKVYFLILLFAKESISKSPTQHSPNTKDHFDITKVLNDTIVEILLKTTYHITARTLLEETKYHRSSYEIENTAKLEPFRDKIFIHNIEIRAVWCNEPKSKMNKPLNATMYYDYVKNEIGLFHKKLSFKIYGYIGAEPKKTNVGFRATLEYRNFNMKATKTGDKFDFKVGGVLIQNRFRLQRHDLDADDSNTTSIDSTTYNILEDLIKEVDPLSKCPLPYHVRKILANRTKCSMPSILFDNIISKNPFSHALNLSFFRQPKQKIISTYPDLLDNEHRYHFFIPAFSIVGLNLSNIKIQGLWNHEWFYAKPSELEGDIFATNMLFVKNICGMVHWDHGYMNMEPLEVYFSAESLYLMYEHGYGIKSISARAVNYNVTRVGPKLDESYQSSVLSKNMKLLIEAAVASSISPSITNQRKNEFEKNFTRVSDELTNWIRQTFDETSQPVNVKTTQQIHHVNSSSVRIIDSIIENDSSSQQLNETPNQQIHHVNWSSVPIIEKKSTSQQSNEKTTEQIYPANSSSVPIIDSIIKKKSTSQPSNKKTTQPIRLVNSSSVPFNDSNTEKKPTSEPYNYRISFPNVTIKLVSATPYTTKQLQCEFFNKSEFDRQINAVMIGALHLNNNKNNSIALNFHCNFDCMDFSIIRPNSSDENATCEFQITNNQEIKVELPPTKNTTKTNDDLEIKKKIDSTLLSMVTQRIFSNLKSAACFPLDVCTQSAKMIDRLVLRFVDKVLRKCSLRRNQTTTVT